MTTVSSTLQQTRDAWDSIASSYDDFVTPENIAFAAEALRHVDIRPGTRVLDVAAGSGAVSLAAARQGASVTAVDISPTMVALLRARARAESLSIDAQVMDGQALDFADGAFDVCASQHGVSLFADMHAGLGEMARVTCQGGRVLVVAFGSFANAEFITFVLRAVNAVAPQSAPPPLDSPPPPFQVADSVALQRAIEDAGLVDVRVESTTWKFEFRSGAQLWRLTTSSNPIARQLIGPLSEAEQSEAVRVLDGMLRERAAGALSATLHTAINIGIGTRSPR